MLVMKNLQRILRIILAKPALSVLPLLALNHPLASCIIVAQNSSEEQFVCHSENWELKWDLMLGRALLSFFILAV